MKEQFEKSIIEVVRFEGEDVICTSGIDSLTPGPDETELDKN